MHFWQDEDKFVGCSDPELLARLSHSHLELNGVEARSVGEVRLLRTDCLSF